MIYLQLPEIYQTRAGLHVIKFNLRSEDNTNYPLQTLVKNESCWIIKNLTKNGTEFISEGSQGSEDLMLKPGYIDIDHPELYQTVDGREVLSIEVDCPESNYPLVVKTKMGDSRPITNSYTLKGFYNDSEEDSPYNLILKSEAKKEPVEQPQENNLIDINHPELYETFDDLQVLEFFETGDRQYPIGAKFAGGVREYTSDGYFWSDRRDDHRNLKLKKPVPQIIEPVQTENQAQKIKRYAVNLFPAQSGVFALSNDNKIFYTQRQSGWEQLSDLPQD